MIRISWKLLIDSVIIYCLMKLLFEIYSGTIASKF